MPELRFPTPLLADDIVLLRPWLETDVPSQLRIFSDPWFQRFSDWEPRTEPLARAALVQNEQARQRGERVGFALVQPPDPTIVLGGASLNRIDPHEGRAEVGYWLAPEGRGKGVATHAVRLLAHWAFQDLGLARLELTCAPDNHASQSVALRCGFTREGTLRSHTPFKGTRRDTLIFSLLPGELK